jgi:16S rRNA (adenine1518-N6/adenine1519-N6)-dimethyltransferase
MSAVFDLKSRLEQMGLQPKKAFGQNFLVNQMVIHKIIEEVKRHKFTDLLEIGPGLGALTEKLFAENLKPTLIELDRDLIDYWKTQQASVIDGDAIQLDWSSLNLKPDSLLVSNLPYQISTHIVIDRCLGPKELKWMVLMFQKEVAQRLTGAPRTKEYGTLSVMAQLHFSLRKVSDAGPKDFFPPPKVASRVLFFERKPDPGLGEPFLKFVKRAFANRRKLLTKNIGDIVTVDDLKALGLSEKARAEELSPEQFKSLFLKTQEA